MIHLTRGQVGAEAVSRIVQTQERVTRQGRGQERGEAVKTAGIIQEAVEDEPLLCSLTRVPGLSLTASPVFAGDGAPGHGDADLGAGPRHAPGEGHAPPGHRGQHRHHPCSAPCLNCLNQIQLDNSNQGFLWNFSFVSAELSSSILLV